MAERIYPLTVPKWGIEMQEGTITEWRADEGARIKKDQELIDIETDKIVNTLEAPVSGVLRRRLVAEGETLSVGELLGVIAGEAASDEDIDAFIEAFVPADARFSVGDEFRSEENEPENSAKADKSSDTPAAGTPDASANDAPAGSARASPVARRLADKLGVDLSLVRGTGRNGRISREDVEAAASTQQTTKEDDADQDDGPRDEGEDGGERLSARARAQARRMVASKQSIPHFYLSRDLDMSRVVTRQRENGTPLTALIVQAMVTALQAEPAVNAHFREERVFPCSGVAINIAVDTREGLVAPLLPALDNLDAAEIAERLSALAERARARQLKAADLEPGGTTLSNLGMFGISAFSAIINPPQVAILAVGAIRPLLLNEREKPVPAMTATLSCDHRVLDGATGARFLAALHDALQQ